MVETTTELGRLVNQIPAGDLVKLRDADGFASTRIALLELLQGKVVPLSMLACSPAAPATMNVSATGFLEAARDVQVERGKDYDSPSGERSMAATVTAFNAITGSTLSEADGWLLLVLLKHVRQQSARQYHHDSALDAVSYTALHAEALARE